MKINVNFELLSISKVYNVDTHNQKQILYLHILFELKLKFSVLKPSKPY